MLMQKRDIPTLFAIAESNRPYENNEKNDVK